MQVVWFVGVYTHSEFGYTAVLVQSNSMNGAVDRVIRTIVGEWEVARADVIHCYVVEGGAPLEYFSEYNCDGICWL